MFLQLVKKLFSSLFFNVVYFLFLLVVSFVWARLVESLNINISGNLSYIITLLLTLLLELLAVYFIRIENLKFQEEYKLSHSDAADPFFADFWDTVKTRDNIIHTITYNVLLVPLYLIIGIGNDFRLIWVILGTVALFLFGSILFCAVNSCIWCVVHKRWMRTKEPRDWGKIWNAILNRLKGQ